MGAKRSVDTDGGFQAAQITCFTSIARGPIGQLKPVRRVLVRFATSDLILILILDLLLSETEIK